MAGKRFNKQDLINHAYNNTPRHRRLTKYMIHDIVDLFFSNIADGIVNNEFVYIRNFATFMPANSAFRKNNWYNTQTKKHEYRNLFYQAKLFKPSQTLIDRVNRNDYNVFRSYFDCTTY